MPVDNEKIKSALDDFENDDFISSKDTLKAEIKGAISDYFKDKLELQKDLEPKAEAEAEVETETETETDTGAEE
jgi:hypothetical protein